MNHLYRVTDLELLEEKRQKAYLRMQRYKESTKKLYDRGVRPRSFQLGDLVLKKVEVSRHVGKLDPKWEGPYKVVKIAKNNSYRLEDPEGRELPRPWNANNLRKFYV